MWQLRAEGYQFPDFIVLTKRRRAHSPTTARPAPTFFTEPAGSDARLGTLPMCHNVPECSSTAITPHSWIECA